MRRVDQRNAYRLGLWSASVLSLFGAVGCSYLCTHDQSGAKQKEQVEQALLSFAAKLQTLDLKPAAMHDLLTEYLEQTPQALGAAFAFAPVQPNDERVQAAPFVYRESGTFVKKDGYAEGGDYTQAEWYAEPVRRQQPCWSKPYFDELGAGTQMITFSVPVYAAGDKKQLVGVVTSDLPMGRRLRLGQHR